MLVYGDRHQLEDPSVRLRAVHQRLDALEAVPPGLDRHARLVGAFVEAGRLLQGVADAAFDRSGVDCRTPAADALGRFLLELARAVCRSWDSRFEDIASAPRWDATEEWPAEVDIRVPEGFAFYAVYPEAYIEAARRLKLIGPPRVIGIRSIGTTLAAAVAAATGAPTAITVRPFGDPFDRQIAIDARLERDLLEGQPHYLIVDEGPGQSGSSFAAVVDWLRQRGVPLERIALLTSHAGSPGPAATDERRMRWNSIRRETGDFGDGWAARIGEWCAAYLGILDQQPEDLSAGAWRRRTYPLKTDWPPIVTAWERRKFLVRRDGEQFLVKFAGLGQIGEDKLRLATTLHGEGLVPQPIGLMHGFLVERWCRDASPLWRTDKPLGEIAHYIGSRARLLPAGSGSGATAAELFAMVRRNVSLEFGPASGRALQRWQERIGELDRQIVPVRTDGKLDRHEWLRARSGELIKTDALDHHQGHDLIGCQDLAWDVAAAIVEFDLDQGSSEELASSVDRIVGRSTGSELLDFYRLAYLAFRLGQMRLGSSSASNPDEQEQLDSGADRYARALSLLLQRTIAATRPKSLVG